MSLSSPTNALPVARIRFSPFAVRGMSVEPVWRPFNDHSVSPWRMMKTLGSGMFGCIRSVGGRGKLDGQLCSRRSTRYAQPITPSKR
jgi:hypothetical protein